MNWLAKQLSAVPLLARVVLLYMLIAVVPLSNLYAARFTNPETSVAHAEVMPTHIAEKPIAKAKLLTGQPIRIKINRLGIDLKVRDGSYDQATNSWSLSDDAVYYATITAAPNDQRGNTFLYGHNTQAILGKTASLVKGDKAIIQTDNGLNFVYKYTGDHSVAPDQTSILSDQPKSPRLTLMTCHGWWDETRRLMYFDLVEVVQ